MASISSSRPSPFRTTFAPSAANLSAMPSPMPLVEPVMSAVLPFISLIYITSDPGSRVVLVVCGKRLHLLHEAVENRAVLFCHDRRSIFRREAALEGRDRGIEVPHVVAERLEQEGRLDFWRDGGVRRI